MRALTTRLRKVQGAALIMAVFFMTLLFGIGLSFIRLIPGEFYSAQRLQTDTAGYYVADAGVTVALAWLESIGSAGVASNINNDWPTSGAGAFNATFPATANASPNPLLAGVKNFTCAPTGAPTPAAGKAFLNGPSWTQVSTNIKNNLLPGWWFDVQIQRYNYRVTNADDTDAKGTYFVIVSEAKRYAHLGSGIDTFRRVRCWARPGNFADDAYAVDTLPSDIWLDLSTFKLTGPYRTNGKALLYAPTNFWPSPTAMPSRVAAINGSVTFWRGTGDANLQTHTVAGVPTVVDGVKYADHSDQTRLPFDKATGVPYDARYQQITVNGRTGINYTSARQDMPENTEALANIALGVTAPSPGVTLGANNATAVFPSPTASAPSVNMHIATQTGTTYPAIKGGIYFEGNIDDVVLSAPATGSDGNGNTSDGNLNSVMTVKQGSKSVNITAVYENFTIPSGSKVNGVTTSVATTLTASTTQTGYTVVKDNATNKYAVYEGTGNGALYFTGDIGGLRGVNRGRKTFATRVDTGSSTTYDKDVTITGNLTRADTTPGQNVTGVRDQLGVISYKVIIADDNKLKKDDGTSATRASTQSNPLLIYGAFVLGRDGDPNANSMTTGGGMGSANYDNLLYGQGSFKLFGSLTEGVRQVKGLIGQSGNSYQYNYDPNMSTLPPPFFPAKNRFRIDAWNEEAVFNY